MPFEPTPGRGMPGAEAYTGIRPEQDTGETPETTTTTTTTTLPPTTTTLAGQTPPPPGQTTTTLPPTTTTLPLDLGHSFSSGFPWFLALVGAAVLAVLIALPELVRRWRRRRHGPITDPVHALLELWDRALRALGAMGFRGDPTQTPIEVSDRAATVFPGVAAPLHELAVVATAASFAPRDDVAQIAATGWSATDHNGPHDWCQTIESVAEESLGWRGAHPPLLHGLALTFCAARSPWAPTTVAMLLKWLLRPVRRRVARSWLLRRKSDARQQLTALSCQSSDGTTTGQLRSDSGLLLEVFGLVAAGWRRAGAAAGVGTEPGAERQGGDALAGDQTHLALEHDRQRERTDEPGE